MLVITIQAGRPVVIVRCVNSDCRRSVMIRWPQVWDRCSFCGERCNVPAPSTEETQPS